MELRRIARLYRRALVSNGMSRIALIDLMGKLRISG